MTRSPIPGLLLALLLAVSLAGCKSASGEGKDVFKEGQALVEAGQYEQAIPVLRGYLTDSPRGEKAAKAGLFLAKAQMALQRWPDARATLDKVIAEHPGTLEAHKCRYKLGLVSLFSGDRADALKRFADMADHPDGSLASDAAAMRKWLEQGGAAK